MQDRADCVAAFGVRQFGPAVQQGSSESLDDGDRRTQLVARSRKEKVTGLLKQLALRNVPEVENPLAGAGYRRDDDFEPPAGPELVVDDGPIGVDGERRLRADGFMRWDPGQRLGRRVPACDVAGRINQGHSVGCCVDDRLLPGARPECLYVLGGVVESGPGMVRKQLEHVEFVD